MTEKRDCDLPVFAQRYPDHTRGSKEAKVKLLEYCDYQCPRCVKAHQIVQSILAEFGDQVQFILRHFPLTDVNPQAQHAAEAAEAAGSQGKFWEMHDRLFTYPQALDDASLVEHALALRLNLNQFLREITGDRHVDRISTHIAQGRNSGIYTAPTFFINQQRFNGDWSQSELIQAVKDVIQQYSKKSS